MREECNRGRTGEDHSLRRRILRVRVKVRSRRNWLVEHPEAGSDRRLMIRERVPGQTDSGIEVQRVRVRLKNVMYLCEDGRRQRIQDRIARLSYANRVGLKVIAQADIERQVRPDFPIVLDVREDLDLTRVTGPGETRMRIDFALELDGGRCQKAWKTAENEYPTLPSHSDVVLNSGYGHANLETVGAVAPKEI